MVVLRKHTPKGHYHTRHQGHLKETDSKGTLSHKAPGSSEGNRQQRNIITQGTVVIWRKHTPKEDYHTRHRVIWRKQTTKVHYHTRHQGHLKERHNKGTLSHKALGSSEGNTHQRNIMTQGTGVVWRKHTPNEHYYTRHQGHLKEAQTEGTLSHKAPGSSEGNTHQSNFIPQGTGVIWKKHTPKKHYHTRHPGRLNETHTKAPLSHKAPGSSEGNTHQRNIITQGTGVIWRKHTPKEHYHTRHRGRLKETHTKGTLSHKAPGSSEGNTYRRNIITTGTGVVWMKHTPKEHYHTRSRDPPSQSRDPPSQSATLLVSHVTLQLYQSTLLVSHVALLLSQSSS